MLEKKQPSHQQRWSVVMNSKAGLIVNRIAGVKRSSVAQRCLFALLLVFLLNLVYLFWKVVIVLNPVFHEFVNVYFIKREIIVCLVVSAAYLFCMLAIWLLRDYRSLQGWLEFLCLQVIALSMAYQGYIFGSVSVVTGMLLMCISIIGLVLFSRIALYSAVFTGVVVLTGTAYAYTAGLLPYAPKFVSPDMFASSAEAFFLINNNFLFSAPIFFGILFLIDFLRTELDKKELLFRNLARLDPLTQIYNRHVVYEYMKKSLPNTHQIGASTRDAIVLLDMDFFKSINDQYGHQIGDQVLIQVANMLYQQIRKRDILARFGGEEFIIILPDTPIIVAYRVAERCREAIAALKIPLETGILRCTASFGVSVSDQREHLDRQIDLADQALYLAKQQGRNRTVVYPPESLMEHE